VRVRAVKFTVSVSVSHRRLLLYRLSVPFYTQVIGSWGPTLSRPLIFGEA
jgi:hypothetical protein